MSDMASLVVVPYIDSILFKFSSENIISALVKNSLKKSNLRILSVAFIKSSCIDPVIQFSSGVTYPSLILEIILNVSAKSFTSLLSFTKSTNFFLLASDIPGMSKPNLSHK